MKEKVEQRITELEQKTIALVLETDIEKSAIRDKSAEVMKKTIQLVELTAELEGLKVLSKEKETGK